MKNKGNQSQVAMNQGAALVKLADYYGTILEVILEIVQNALDSKANKIWIEINKRKREIIIRDNGEGVTRFKFEQALLQICKTMKTEDALGRFGMGLIAALGKCVKFTFTSRRKSQLSQYICWEFATDKIAKQAKTVVIPNETIPLSPQKWNTSVCVEKYTTDRIKGKIGSIEELIVDINDRYRRVLKKRGVIMSIVMVDESGQETRQETIKAQEFEGNPLEEIEIRGENGMVTKFNLFVTKVSPNRKEKGRIHLGEEGNDFRFPLTARAAMISDLLDVKILNILTSGLFEGEITNNQVQLDPNRRHFVKNDQLVGLCVAIEEWYDRSGQHYIDDIRSSQKEERYQELGLQSLKSLEALLKDEEFKHLRDVISQFKIGTTGTGHIESTGNDQTQPSLATRGKHKKHGTPSERTDRQKPQTHLKGHIPFAAIGPKGTHRKVVKHHSFGLQFCHSPMMGDQRLWVLSVEEGILYFNIRHPLWEQVESSDRQIMKLQECIAIQALALQSLPPEWQEKARIIFDEFTVPFIFLIQNSHAYTGGREKKKTD